MRFRYATVDVFTDKRFAGNPVAMVRNAKTLSTAQMQAVAAEFNYIETSFVSPPSNPFHTAAVRIFTPDREVPFAGHPNIGTAFLLAREIVRQGDLAPERFVFEEAAGLVRVELVSEEGLVVGAELLAPEPLAVRSQVDPSRAAACLGLTADDVLTDTHAPRVISVGLPSLVLEVASRDALRRATPDRQSYNDLLPLDGARSVYVYTRDVGGGGLEGSCDLQARMFTWRLMEDPATGSATAALTALLSRLRGEDIRLRVAQGTDMGRSSLLLTRTLREGGVARAFVGGRCAAMFEGGFELD